MAFLSATLTPLFGWLHHHGRTKAFVKVSTQGGDTTSDTNTSDARGVAWAEANFAVGPDGFPDSLGSATAVVVGTAAIPGRQLAVTATTAGPVVVTLRNGSSFTFQAAVGTTILPLAVGTVVSGPTGATYTNLT